MPDLYSGHSHLHLSNTEYVSLIISLNIYLEYYIYSFTPGYLVQMTWFFLLQIFLDYHLFSVPTSS